MWTKRLFAITMFVGALFFAASSATALTIYISDTQAARDGYATDDGTKFRAAANPSSPSTGTGVFEPFLRIHESSGGDGLQNGYNTDTGEPDINFDTKNGSNWTRAIPVSELGNFVTLDFALDANQEGPVGSADNRILLTDVQIYIGSAEDGFATPEVSGGYTGTPFVSPIDEPPGSNLLLGQAPNWSLDNATNGDVTVELEAAICGAVDSRPGQCGSGHGDMVMSIPRSALGDLGPEDYLVFYTEFEGANGGFEEWKVQPVIPEPTAALLFGVGALIVSRHSGGRRR
jgi:hypothetical protein